MPDKLIWPVVIKLLIALVVMLVAWAIAQLVLAHQVRKLCEEFAERFPGRCLICFYHKYGFLHGHEDLPRPKPHHCIEKAIS